MKSLLKEFAAYGDAQAALKNSDGSDAGRSDTASKPVDVKFNLMRNAINTDGGVDGADVNDYLERAHELNDQVETVGFAIEDEDGGIIKVYVNSQQAGEFEEEMSKILGLDDDVEAAINQVAQKFDIVDVVWPEEPADGSENIDSAADPDDADLTIDSSPDAFSLEDPAAEDELAADALPADDENDGESASGADEPAADADVEADAPVDGEVEPEAEGDEDTGDEEEEDDEEEEEVSDEDELEPVLDNNGEQKLDADGNPVMRKKRKRKEEPATDDTVTTEGVREDILSHVAKMVALGDKGKFYIEALATGGYGGPRRRVLSREGKTFFFMNREQAVQEADRLTKYKNKAGAKASYKFVVKMVEARTQDQPDRGEKFSLDAIRKGLKRVHAEAAAVDSQEAYNVFLEKFGALADVVDSYINPNSLDGSADKLHYHQKDPQVAEFIKKYIIEGESDMTIGSKFLERVLAEATKDEDGVQDGLNIPMDSQQRLLANRLKRPIEKKIVGLFAMSGILGRLLVANDGVEDSIMSAADMLRKNRSALAAFNTFFTALANAKGYAVEKQKVAEALLEASKLKRGSALQKKFETVLVKLGLPEDLVAIDGPGALGPVLFRTTKLIDADTGLQGALNKLALRLGITGQDVNAPLDEAVDVGTDEFFQKVVALAVALGIPEKNLQFQRPNVIKSLRAKKMSLSNRGMIEQRMDALLAMVEKATRKTPATPQLVQTGQQQTQAAATANESIGYFTARRVLKEANLTEAFGDLEALVGKELDKFSLVEPEAGPAMKAAYEGAAQHEETVLTVGVDPDHEGNKALVVSIDGPWDGNMHKRNFTNDKAGYKAAMDYANMLRTANLGSGGRPRGWKDDATAEV